MAETLYAILNSGEVLTIGDVTALALDSTPTIKPGDFYRNEWIEQTIGSVGSDVFVVTEQKGDQVTPSALRTESWLCSFWKFTRGASLPILYLKWADVAAICNLLPDTINATAQIYLPLHNGRVAVYSGITAGTTSITINSSQTVYPGDYFRNSWIEQGIGTSGGLGAVLTNQRGDAPDGDALNPETFDASHYEFTRAGLITLWAPWAAVRGGPSTAYPI